MANAVLNFAKHIVTKTSDLQVVVSSSGHCLGQRRAFPLGIDGVQTRIILLALCITSILLYEEGAYPPVHVSAGVFVLSGWWLLRLYQISGVGLLSVLLYVVYALPFIHVAPYMWFDFEAPPPVMLWGYPTNPYMVDRPTIELMSLIGALGASALVFGAVAYRRPHGLREGGENGDALWPIVKTLTLPRFALWTGMSILFSWLYAPSETIFTAAYTTSLSISHGWNFSSTWMLSYSLLLFVAADSLVEKDALAARIKRRIVLVATLIIVIWYQLLRGDRESLTCVIAIVLMYYLWGNRSLASTRTKRYGGVLLVTIGFLVVAATSFLLSKTRSASVGVRSFSGFVDLVRDLAEAGLFSVDRLITGTWSGVLLTPLSIAGDLLHGSLSPAKYGQTYLDLIASILPGFMSNWIGYVRPIDGWRGPAWEMTYGLGGTHAVVVPFMNFRMVGVFMIIAMAGFVVSMVEQYSIRRRSVCRVALWGTFAMVMPHWLWYGEKYVINAVIIWVMLGFLYRFSSKFRMSSE